MPEGRGGKRPNAGRKPGIPRSRAQLLTQVFGPEDWLKLFKPLQKLALSDDPRALRAASLLLRYQFGSSVDSVHHSLLEETRKAAFALCYEAEDNPPPVRMDEHGNIIPAPKPPKHPSMSDNLETILAHFPSLNKF